LKKKNREHTEGESGVKCRARKRVNLHVNDKGKKQGGEGNGRGPPGLKGDETVLSMVRGPKEEKSETHQTRKTK